MRLVAIVFTLTASTILYFPADRPDLSRASTTRREWDLNSESLSKRLDLLMERSAPYRNANLTLVKLAHMLGEDPKPLTYHFKTCLSTNFRGYLNGLRLKAVCRDLVDKPHSTILTIAFENGFNSKSSFNMLFYETFAVTPRNFRAAGGLAVSTRPRTGHRGRLNTVDIPCGDCLPLLRPLPSLTNSHATVSL